MENVMNRSFHLPEFRTEVSTRHGMFAACYNKVTDSMSQNIMLQNTRTSIIKLRLQCVPHHSDAKNVPLFCRLFAIFSLHQYA